MLHAIFFAVARDAKFEIGIAQLRRAADGASVKRFIFAARTILKTFSANGDFMTMARSRKKLGPEKDQVIGQRRHQ